MTFRKLRTLSLAGLVAGASITSVAWLSVQQRPYPRGVQFRAPHQRTVYAAINRVWFRPYAPPILERLRVAWIPTVYAQSCTTPLCNFTVGEETNIACPTCGPTFYWQNCVATNQNKYCSQSMNNCDCQRAANSKCNPIN